jgi:hypothetical protein
MKRRGCAFAKGSRWAAVILAFVAFTIAIPSAHAADGTWNLTGGGAWGDAANWSPATVPDGIDAIANLANNITGDATVALDSPPAGNRTVGTLNLGDADGSHVFNVKLQGAWLSFRYCHIPSILPGHRLGRSTSHAVIGPPAEERDDVSGVKSAQLLPTHLFQQGGGCVSSARPCRSWIARWTRSLK